MSTLDNQKTDITNSLDSINKLAITLNRQKKILIDAIDTYPAALRVLARERSKFTKLLTSLDNLGKVATRVINATQQPLVTSLKALNPVLTQLKNSGDFFPKSLRILGTFPFPLGATRELVRGDYANLSAYLNLDLGETLCQGAQNTLGKTLCDLLSTPATSGASAKSTRLAKGTKSPTPVLIESGR